MDAQNSCEQQVASLAGAWIETDIRGLQNHIDPGRLPRGGVDRNIFTPGINDWGTSSPPSRGRGSKLWYHRHRDNVYRVASLAGAWIETLIDLGGDADRDVASLAGAWIETRRPARDPRQHVVA